MTDAPADELGTPTDQGLTATDLLTHEVIRAHTHSDIAISLAENIITRMIEIVLDVELDATIHDYKDGQTLSVGDFVKLAIDTRVTRGQRWSTSQLICMEHLRVELHETLHATAQPNST